MRIGEIAILGPQLEERKRFIAALCNKIDFATEHLVVGRLPINDQLMLHLYGLAGARDSRAISWDLIARKVLGYIVLFSWQNSSSFEAIKPVIDQITARSEVALVVAARVTPPAPPAMAVLGDRGLDVGNEGKFTFWEDGDAGSAKKVLLALVDLVLSRGDELSK